MNAHSIGLAAAQVTSRGGEAKVIGITSRGLFLSIDQRVLFVSVERWRGPLTINVDRTFDCALGDSVRLSPTRLIFPAIEIDLSAAEVWQPTAPAIARSIADQREALRQLASSVLARKAPEGFGLLLPHLLDLPEKQALSASEAALLARLTQLRESKDARRSAQDALMAFNQRVVESAYQRTTTISANLIECAANGEADERLINVIDGLVTGTPSRDDCVEGVIGWGNSSGLDALIGMALAAA